MANKEKILSPKKNNKIELSLAKKNLFWVITIIIPFLIFILLEITLQIINYGGNLSLFIDGPKGYEEFKQCNPNVARRYFGSEESVPTPPIQLFRKTKNANGIRYFVLGGSSAAGFPYGNNVSFPKVLESQLKLSHPQNDVEVINIAMSAINTYALLDMMDEVIEEEPDAILVYAGHNEFYGALGVGSVQSLGNWRWLVRSYLALHKIKTFLMVKDAVMMLKNATSTAFVNNESGENSNTLMARIVGEQTIALDSELYKRGKEQFSENMNLIVEKAQENNIRIILSELVSNIKDQKPFISINNENAKSADYFFKKGESSEANGNYNTAKFHYLRAKDLDALRFRAPEEFNIILKDISQNLNVALVPLTSYFERNSKYGIMGRNLFLEHLHPNREGYELIAKAFFESIEKTKKVEHFKHDDSSEFILSNRFTELDSIYASLVVDHLKSGWPFKEKNSKNTFIQNYSPKTKVEEIAFKIMIQKDYNLESGHMELGNYYNKLGENEKSYNEFSALIASIPHEISFYEKAATSLIKQKKYKDASELLIQSLLYKDSDFAFKWIGQIALMNENYSKSIKFLLLANHNDPQVLFNLSRSYYHFNNNLKGDEYLNKLAQNHPNSKYIPYLYNVRKQLR